MDILSVNSSTLRSLISLYEKREKLQAEIGKIEDAIKQATGGEIPFPFHTKEKAAKLRKSRQPKARPSGRRGALKERMLAELHAAGKSGVTVKDLAEKLAVKPQNIHVWFATTGKTVGVKKLGPGKFSL